MRRIVVCLAVVLLATIALPAAAAAPYTNQLELVTGKDKQDLRVVGPQDARRGTWQFRVTTAGAGTTTFVQLYAYGRKPHSGCIDKANLVQSHKLEGPQNGTTIAIDAPDAGQYCVRGILWGPNGSTATIEWNTPVEPATSPLGDVLPL